LLPNEDGAVIPAKLGWRENHLARRFAEVTEPLDTELINYNYGVMRVRLKAPLFMLSVLSRAVRQRPEKVRISAADHSISWTSHKRLPAQTVDATLGRSLLAGVLNPKVFLGRWFRRSATRSSCAVLTDEEKASLVLADDPPFWHRNRKSELLSDEAYDYFRRVDLKVFG